MELPETIAGLVMAQAMLTPNSPVFYGDEELSWADFATRVHDAKTVTPVMAIDHRNPISAIADTIAALDQGAALLAPMAPVKRAAPGELIFPVQRQDDGTTDLIRHSQFALFSMARALVSRFDITEHDSIAISGSIADPAAWLILTAGLIAHAPVSFGKQAATIAWMLDGAVPAAEEGTRLIHCRADRDTLAALLRARPDATIVNGLTLPQAMGLPICSDPRDPVHTIASTCGRPLGTMEVMIVDPRSGLDMLLYETGEVWLRGPGIMAGHATGIAPFEPGRFLRTGILGHLDSEGRLVLSRPEEDALRDMR